MLKITIDLDRPCPRCGRFGIADNGLCLRCVARAIEAGEFDDVLKPGRPATATRDPVDADTAPERPGAGRVNDG